MLRIVCFHMYHTCLYAVQCICTASSMISSYIEYVVGDGEVQQYASYRTFTYILSCCALLLLLICINSIHYDILYIEYARVRRRLVLYWGITMYAVRVHVRGVPRYDRQAMYPL